MAYFNTSFVSREEGALNVDAPCINQVRVKTIIDSTALVLVAIIPTPRDLEIARMLGWYRIPVRTAPKVIAVDYIAFYQPASFEVRKWMIEYIAEVKGHELTTRAELIKDEPDHPRAHEEYYKIQIGPLIKLPRTIYAERWKRITFLYTTGEYLVSANKVNDLVVREQDRKVLWHSLRERLNAAYPSHTEGDKELDLDEDLLFQLLFQIKDGEEPYTTDMDMD